MTYAEVEFIKAEMAWRGLITDQAAPHYRKAVEAIIEQWGGVVPGDYFDNPKATYDGTLERILLQNIWPLSSVIIRPGSNTAVQVSRK